eukprot:TRINITY_DN84873_c0_g1_i1.p1 TRINITY_DN84873_c0_g1~~TRINITY_DN84873_c0_g1_i1.p1  ORF type:complete len:171 (+),score=45.67 TRINITY_DN84873_c0_g1_i1:70-582(+)
MAVILLIAALLAAAAGNPREGQSTACSEEQVEELEESLAQSMQIQLLQTRATMEQGDIIGCSGGIKPVSVGCSSGGDCTYKCTPDSTSQVVCSQGKVIGQDACSGGGCSWSCKSILGCSQKPKLLGCTRMAGSNTCTWECPSPSSGKMQCAEGSEPKQDACGGGGCSFLC